jgi:hypothetical protein
MHFRYLRRTVCLTAARTEMEPIYKNCTEYSSVKLAIKLSAFDHDKIQTEAFIRHPISTVYNIKHTQSGVLHMKTLLVSEEGHSLAHTRSAWLLLYC